LAERYYPADFSQQDLYGLEQELNILLWMLPAIKELESVATLAELFQCFCSDWAAYYLKLD
jgi:hypothetical protein